MKKGEKRTPQRRIVSLGPDTYSGSGDQLADSKKLGMKRATTITRSTIILASAERCFELISKQLEETPNWDPTIMWVNPISIKHIRVGSMSRVNFSLDGVREEAVAMIRSFQPNRSILWTSNHSSQLQEQWYLEPEPHGTLVTVTLGYNPGGWLFGRLADKIVMKRKVEKAVSEMLEKLKTAAETPK
ncbi:SRPBCC family protein [Chloroflexota bacterium]